VLRQLRFGSALSVACRQAGIVPSTFWRWRKKWPRIAELADRLIASRIGLVEDALFQACVQDRNMTAIIFFLTNRAGDKWADRRALVNNTNVFNAKAEVPKDAEGESIGSALARIDKIRESLIPPGDPK